MKKNIKTFFVAYLEVDLTFQKKCQYCPQKAHAILTSEGFGHIVLIDAHHSKGVHLYMNRLHCRPNITEFASKKPYEFHDF